VTGKDSQPRVILYITLYRKSDKEQIRKRRKPINGKKKVQKCAKENAAPTVRISSSGRIIKTNVRV